MISSNIVIDKAFRQDDIELKIKKYTWFNPYLTNVSSYHYQLGESTFIFRGVRSELNFFNLIFSIKFLCKFLCKQDSPRWDAAFCGVTSGAMLFVYVPQKGRQA